MPLAGFEPTSVWLAIKLTQLSLSYIFFKYSLMQIWKSDNLVITPRKSNNLSAMKHQPTTYQQESALIQHRNCDNHDHIHHKKAFYPVKQAWKDNENTISTHDCRQKHLLDGENYQIEQTDRF